MARQIIIATDRGVHLAERGNSAWEIVQHGLASEEVMCVIAREGVILAGTANGVHRSDDLGQTWIDAGHGLAVRYVRWLAFDPALSDREFAGTEPAAIFTSRDGAGTWQECLEVADLRDRYGWWLPYSPRAGCVRGFAFHGRRVYAAVEVGGVLRSDDGGATWDLAPGSSGDPGIDDVPPEPVIFPDVHSVTVHPSSPDLVFAPTGGGFYCSRDGGATWERLYDCYCRAVWLDPQDAEHLVLGPADGVDRRGRIEETLDGGRTWRAAASGLNAPWPSHMVEHFTQVDEDLLAVLSNGHVLAAPLATLAWQRVLPEIGNANAVTVMVA